MLLSTYDTTSAKEVTLHLDEVQHSMELCNFFCYAAPFFEKLFIYMSNCKKSMEA